MEETNKCQMKCPLYLFICMDDFHKMSHLLIHVNNDNNSKMKIFPTQIASSSVEDAAATRPGSLSARTRVPGLFLAISTHQVICTKFVSRLTCRRRSRWGRWTLPTWFTSCTIRVFFCRWTCRRRSRWGRWWRGEDRGKQSRLNLLKLHS